MKKNIIKAMAAGILTLGLVSCENSEVEFPDFQDGVSVYFSYQTPVRSMMLGTDDLGSTADNDTHACKIYGRMGGAYNGKDITVQVKVDESLCEGLYFDQACTKPVVPMPASYYQLGGNTLNFNGDMKGGVDVKLTDAFFADPKAATVNYVIPVVMTSQTGADYILTGELAPGIESGNRFDDSQWSVAPKDYVLYCVKYVSKFEGYYLPKINASNSFNGVTEQLVKTYAEWERVPSGEILYLGTQSKDVVTMPVTIVTQSQPMTVQVTVKDEKGNVVKDESGNPKKEDKQITLKHTCSATLALSFNGNECTVAGQGNGAWSHEEWDAEKETIKSYQESYPMTVTGKGTYTEQADKYMWGNKKRNGLNINAEIKLEANSPIVCKAEFDMALQRRGQGNTVEEFTVTLKK